MNPPNTEPGNDYRHFNHEANYNKVIREAAKFGERCEILRGYADDFLSHFQPQSFDFVWLDADHTFEATHREMRHWLPMARHCLCGHDYSRWGVGDAVRSTGMDHSLGDDDTWFIML